jgi:hypothetical protein
LTSFGNPIEPVEYTLWRETVTDIFWPTDGEIKPENQDYPFALAQQDERGAFTIYQDVDGNPIPAGEYEVIFKMDGGADAVELGLSRVEESDETDNTSFSGIWVFVDSEVESTDTDGTDDTETDDTETDNTETDDTETDNTETDNTETDGSETESSETDGIETDGSETDGSETDSSETDGSETDDTETDGSETDGIETDGSNDDGTEPDGSDDDGTETDGPDTDGIETDGSETQGFESEDSETQGSESEGSETQGSESEDSETQGFESEDSETQGFESESEEMVLRRGKPSASQGQDIVKAYNGRRFTNLPQPRYLRRNENNDPQRVFPKTMSDQNKSIFPLKIIHLPPVD